MAHHLTTCTFCGVGCGIYLETSGGRVTGGYPSMSHPANEGRICLRGWHVHEVASSPDRLKLPLVRKGETFQEVSWEEALGLVAARLLEIRDRHGPDALAFLNSPRCSNEETYLLQKLARAVIGTNNVDHGTGVYCNNSIQILLEMLGVPATTNSLGDLACSQVILVDGVDLAKQLPTIGGRVLRSKLNGARLIVIDSRRHRLADSADHFLQLRPGTETILYGAMAKVIVDRGLHELSFIRSHCRDYEFFLKALEGHDLLMAAQDCGLTPAQIEVAALAYAQAGRAAILFSTGIEARSMDSIRALVNLALLRGNVGKEGAGVYALTEHNNLQGVCDMGMLPDRLPGYLPVEDPAARARVESVWRVKLPSKAGLSARRVLTDRGQRKVRGLWLCRYDPVSSALFGEAARTLEELELVVVQHLFMTGTARHAHVVLPVTAFGEEQVSFTSTERRIQLASKVIDPSPGLTPAWEQLARVANLMGARWNYLNAAAVMDEIGQVVPFYGGAAYDNLQRDYGRQWPCTKDKPLGTPFLFEDGIVGQPFRFAPIARPQRPAMLASEHPYVLVFGHSLYYWHQNVLVQHSETLKREYQVLLLDYPNGFVEINSGDAKSLNIRDGEIIRLRTTTGSATAAARLTHEVKSGTVFVPYFVREVERQLLGDPGISPDPVAVRVEKV